MDTSFLFDPTIKTLDTVEPTIIFVILFTVIAIMIFINIRFLLKTVRTIKYKDNNLGKVFFVIWRMAIFALLSVVIYLFLIDFLKLLNYVSKIN